jgi:hypothetical protein
MAKYLFGSERFNPLADGHSDLLPAMRALRDLVDTSDPAWPTIACTLREFVAAGIDLDAATVAMAVKLGKQRAATAEPPSLPDGQLTLAAAGGIVYYIRRADLIKIGTTIDPCQRFRDLLPDEILAVEPGGRRQEAWRHQQFGHLRAAGEYFRDASELRMHVERMRVLHGDPDPSWPTSANAKGAYPVWSMPLPDSTATMTVAEAERDLGIKANTIYAWAHRGRLPLAGRDDRGRSVYYVQHLVALRNSARARMVTRL